MVTVCVLTICFNILIFHFLIFNSADFKSLQDPIYRSIVVHHWSKVKGWPEDGFVKAETGRLSEYPNIQVVLD
jgi:hypothetical protein